MPVDPFYRIFFPDGTHFDYSGDEQRMRAEIRRLGADQADVEGYRAFVRRSEQIFAKGFTELATVPFLHVWDMVKIVPDLLRLESYRTVYGFVSRHVQDERLRQVLSFHPLLVGGNPFQTTSIYTLIHYLEREWGVWYALGGTGAIVEAMARLLGELGGALRLNAEVGQILIEQGRATGVRLTNGEDLAADVVVCNADVAGAYAGLLPPSARPSYTDRRLARMRYSMSLVVIYFGTDRQYRGDDGPALAHHDIILGPRYEGLLTDIFTRKTLARRLLALPAHADADRPLAGAPRLRGVLRARPGAASRRQVDWARAAKPYRDRIMGFLEDHYLPGLSPHLVTEHMIDPRHFRDTLNSYLGSAFSVEPILTQSAYFRPHNRSEELPNLYFVGAGTHPGAGLPGVLCSAKIVDDLIAAAVDR